jgi:hypothetical protein
MKFKAVTNSEAPQAFIDALDDLRATWELEVLRDCFGIQPGSLTPAEFYVQRTDFAKGHTPFINYNLSGVTIKQGRDFERALETMCETLSGLVGTHWYTAFKMAIFVVIHTSSSDGTVSRLIESQICIVDPKVK